MPDTTIPGATTVSTLKAHVAVPPVGDGPWPAVVVLHEAFGLTDDTRQQADRLARRRYLAVAPDLFSAGGVRCLRATFSAMTAGTARLRRHRRRPTVRRGAPPVHGRRGVLGFCMGGGFRAGRRHPRVRRRRPQQRSTAAERRGGPARGLPRRGQLRWSRPFPARGRTASGGHPHRRRRRARRPRVPRGRALVPQPAQRGNPSRRWSGSPVSATTNRPRSTRGDASCASRDAPARRGGQNPTGRLTAERHGSDGRSSPHAPPLSAVVVNAAASTPWALRTSA